MDAGTMAGIGAAFNQAGQGLDEGTQMMFKAQIDAANNAQRVGLAKLQQQAEDERAANVQAGENTRAAAARDQAKTFHEQDATARAAQNAATNTRGDAELALHTKTAAATIRNINSEITKREAGGTAADPKVHLQLTALSGRSRVLNDRVNSETKVLAGMLDTSGTGYKQLRETLRRDTAERDKVDSLLNKLTTTMQPITDDGGDTGVAPSTGPVNAQSDASGNAAWLTARNAVPVGGTYIGPDGKSYTRGQ